MHTWWCSRSCWPGLAWRAQQASQSLHNHVHREVIGGQAPLVGSLAAGAADESFHRADTAQSGRIGKPYAEWLYDPTSPDFRQFLTVDQFTERFGPTAHDYQAAVSFARANGFTITGTPANRLVVPISGTVDQINSAFHLRMNVYRHPTQDRTFTLRIVSRRSM